MSIFKVCPEILHTLDDHNVSCSAAQHSTTHASIYTRTYTKYTQNYPFSLTARVCVCLYETSLSFGEHFKVTEGLLKH